VELVAAFLLAALTVSDLACNTNQPKSLEIIT
jgi:hypothetical protein